MKWPKKLEFYAKTMIHVHDASVFMTMCLKTFPSRLTSCTVSLLIDVARCSIEELWNRNG